MRFPRERRGGGATERGGHGGARSPRNSREIEERHGFAGA
jgi:hypothetical protein